MSTALAKYLGHSRVHELVEGSVPTSDIRDSLLTALGFSAGGIIGYEHGHVVLGLLSGTSIGRNAPALFDEGTRSEGLWNLAQTHAGVAAALLVKDDSVVKRAIYFVLGVFAVGIARYLKERGYDDEVR